MRPVPNLTLRREDGRVVAESVTVADSTMRRLRGLLGKRDLPSGYGVLLRPAWSIHTAFMRFPIDVVFLDPDQVVIAPGSKPLLFALLDILQGDVMLPRPSWVSYEPQVKHAGPEDIQSLPRLGSDLDIDMDKVEALQPDLVLASLSVPGMVLPPIVT